MAQQPVIVNVYDMVSNSVCQMTISLCNYN